MLAEYVEDLRRCRFLTREEEWELAERARAGDVEARNRLIEGVLPLAFKVARDFCRRSHAIRLDDAVSIASRALIRAAQRFDHTRGFRFGTFASHVVRGELSHEARIAMKRKRPLSLDLADGSTRDVPDLSEAADPTRGAARSDRAGTLRAAMPRLHWREREVIERKAAGETFGQIGRRFGVTKEGARQIRLRGLEKLRMLLRAGD